MDPGGGQPVERLLALQTTQPALRPGWRTDLVYVVVNRPVVQGGLIVLLAAVGVIPWIRS